MLSSSSKFLDTFLRREPTLKSTRHLSALLISVVLVLIAATSATHPTIAQNATASPTTSATSAANPDPVTPALTAPFAYGVASGDMTADNAVLWTRTPSAASVIAESSESET